MSKISHRKQLDAPEAKQSVADYFALEWPRDAEGFYHRQAARVVAVNEHLEALLVRGHDFSDAAHWWWFTVGGGLEPGETPHEAAVREFFEETGYRLDPETLIGPVLRRHATFDFHQLTCKQDEDFFFVKLPGTPCFSREHETAVEKQVIDELKWWNLAELEQVVARGTVVYPLDFVSLVRGWLRGWDGNTREISEGTVSPKNTVFPKGTAFSKDSAPRLESPYA